MTDEEKYNARACEITHEGINTKLGEHDGYLKELKTMAYEFKEQTSLLMEIVRTMRSKQDIHTMQIEEIRQKPAKNWDRVTSSIMDFLILGVLGYILFTK